MAIGRPKNPIPRDEKLTLRLTKFEAEKISKIAQKKISQELKQFCRALIC